MSALTMVCLRSDFLIIITILMRACFCLLTSYGIHVTRDFREVKGPRKFKGDYHFLIFWFYFLLSLKGGIELMHSNEKAHISLIS